MNLRTRKWGCALGITLLIAVPVALAVWIGLALSRPGSAEAKLRAIPLFPGASQAVYTTPHVPLMRQWQGNTARVVYRVKDSPEAVVGFHIDNLTGNNWRVMEYRLLDKIETYIGGVHLTGRAPWVEFTRYSTRSVAYVTAHPIEGNAEGPTEVIVEITGDAMYEEVFVR